MARQKSSRASARHTSSGRQDLRARERMAPHVRSYAEYRACCYLIRHGMTFGAEFGYSNAREIARQHRAAVKAGKRYVR